MSQMHGLDSCSVASGSYGVPREGRVGSEHGADPAAPTVPKFAHDRALHYLAGRQECELPDGVRHWLTQVVEGYTGRCDEGAARRGIEWMRDKARARGETPPL